MRHATVSALLLVQALAGAFAAWAADDAANPSAQTAPVEAKQDERQRSQEPPDPEASPEKDTRSSVEWHPSPRGAPGTLRGGGTRGAGAITGRVEALAPNESFFTLEPQPVLYWYLERDDAGAVRFQLLEEEAAHPIVASTLRGPKTAGVHAIRLSDHGVSLEVDVRYRWTVTLIGDPGRSDDDVVDMAELMRIRDETTLSALRGADPADKPFVLAAHGIWYDALHQFSADRASRYRAELLHEGGFPIASEAALQNVGGSDR